MGAVDQLIAGVTGFGGGIREGWIGIILSQFTKIVKFAVAGLVIALIMWWARENLAYNKIALIRKLTSDGKVQSIIAVPAKELYHKKLGMTLWQLKIRGKKVLTPKPDNEFITLWKKKEACEFWMDSSADLHNIQTEKLTPKKPLKEIKKEEQCGTIAAFFKQTFPEPKLTHDLNPVLVPEVNEKVTVKPVPQNRKGLHLALHKAIHEKSQARSDWMAKYGNLAMIGGTLLVVFLIMFFFMEHVGEGLQSLAASLGQVATSCRPG